MDKYSISKLIFLNTFHILVSNLLKMELAKQTVNLMFDKDLIIYPNRGDNREKYHFYTGALLNDKTLELSYASDNFFKLDYTATKNRFNSQFNLLYTFRDLYNYLPVLKFNDTINGRELEKTNLKVSGFYILYNFLINFDGYNTKDGSKFFDVCNFNYILEAEIRLVFHNFGFFGDEMEPMVVHDYLMWNSLSTMKTLQRKSIKITAPNNNEMFSEFGGSFLPNSLDIVNKFIDELDDSAYNHFFQDYFNRNYYQMILKDSSTLTNFINAIGNRLPVNMGKMVKSCRKLEERTRDDNKH